MLAQLGKCTSAAYVTLPGPVVEQTLDAIAISRGSFDAICYRRDRTLEGPLLARDLARNLAALRLVREPSPFNLRLTNARIHVRRRKARLRLVTALHRRVKLLYAQASPVKQRSCNSLNPKSMTAYRSGRTLTIWRAVVIFLRSDCAITHMPSRDNPAPVS
jgi:hypothetical protein